MDLLPKIEGVYIVVAEKEDAEFRDLCFHGGVWADSILLASRRL